MTSAAGDVIIKPGLYVGPYPGKPDTRVAEDASHKKNIENIF